MSAGSFVVRVYCMGKGESYYDDGFSSCFHPRGGRRECRVFKSS